MNILLRRIAGLLLSLGAALLAGPTQAQDYPTKPVHMVVAGAAGSGLDFIGRTLALALEKQLGQPFVVEPEPSGGGLIAHRRVAKREAPDGYTLLFTGSVYLTHAVALKEPGYDVEKDLAPLSLIATGPFGMVTNMTAPFSTFAEMVAYAKANPGKLNFGIAGPADAFSLMMEGIKAKYGIDITGIAYRRGTPDWMAGLMAGDLHASFGAFTSVIPLVQDKKLRMLAVSGDQRVPAFPDVPSFAEVGMPDIRNQAFLLFGVAKTPQPIINKLNAAITKAYETPEVKAAFARIGFTAVGSRPEVLAKRVKDEVEFYQKAARSAGVLPQ